MSGRLDAEERVLGCGSRRVPRFDEDGEQGPSPSGEILWGKLPLPVPSDGESYTRDAEVEEHLPNG